MCLFGLGLIGLALAWLLGASPAQAEVSSTTLRSWQGKMLITWYVDGKPVFKLVKELIDGGLFIIPGRKEMPTQSVRLRLIVTANSWEAQYRPAGESEFQTAETGELPAPNDDQVSIQCYNGPEEGQHWVRFSNFCIKKL
mgnify:CR=1 FL=1